MLNAEEKEKIEAYRKMLPYILNLCGWSKAALGRMLGVSRQCINGIIKGKQNMTMAQYIAIRHLVDTWMWNHADGESLMIYCHMMEGDKYWNLNIFEKVGIIF